MEYWLRLWRGEMPLGQTFWLFGFLGNAVMGIGVVGLAVYLFGADGNPTGAQSIMVRVLGFLALAYTGFTLVAVWRSADHFQGRRLWGVLAKVWVVVVPLQVGYGFVV